MKLINVIIMSLKFMYVRKRRIILSFTFSIIALYVTIQINVTMGFNNVLGESITKVLSKDPDLTYSIEYKEGFPEDGSLNEESRELASYIANMEGVDSHGYFTVTTDRFKELKNNNEYYQIMKELYGNSQSEDFRGISSVVYVEPTAINICKVEVYEGTADITYDEESETIPLLAGYSLKDILPIGTIITEDSSGIKYKVAGILKKNSNWLEVGDASFSYTFSLGNNLDGMMVAPINPIFFENLFEDIAQTYYFNLEDDSHTDKIINEIQDKADSLGLNASIYSVSEKINRMNSEKNSYNKLRILIMIFSTFIIILLLATSFISYLVKHKSEFGILYANGIDTNNVVQMVIMENSFMIIISGVIAYCYSLVDFLKGEHTAYFLTYYNILTGKALKYLIITVIFILIVSSLSACIYLSRIKPVDLIGGNGE